MPCISTTRLPGTCAAAIRMTLGGKISCLACLVCRSSEAALIPGHYEVLRCEVGDLLKPAGVVSAQPVTENKYLTPRAASGFEINLLACRRDESSGSLDQMLAIHLNHSILENGTLPMPRNW